MGEVEEISDLRAMLRKKGSLGTSSAMLGMMTYTIKFMGTRCPSQRKERREIILFSERCVG